MGEAARGTCAPVGTADYLLKLARALGVEVEPDEPALPDRLTLTRKSGSSCTAAVWWIMGDGSTLAIDTSDSRLDHVLAVALIAAYNNRPRYRYDAPPSEPGTYLVHMGTARTAYWDGKGWNVPLSYGLTTISTSPQTPWMPVPEL
jgi:hypothetical protein